jgi:hypothetical protein
VSGATDSYRFIAWSRRGLAAAIPSQGGGDGHATLPVTLTVKKGASETEPVEKTLRFYGPGDVVQIDNRQIIRREPRPGASDFEPNYFPLIEFDVAEFPWLISPEPSGVRVQPWLVLVVVRREAARVAVDPRRPLPWLMMASSDAQDELPDLAESWAWAHAQLVGTSLSPADALNGPPELTLSRLLCPRRLQPQTAYLACLVPAYRAGVQAGLGKPVDAGGEPAWPPPEGWSAAGASFELPLYDQWEFTTAEVGDFELLVRRLRPQRLGPDIGALRLDIGDPGSDFDDLELTRPTELPLEGALTSPELPEREWPAGVETDFKQRLEDLIVLPPGVEETVLRPPIYGSFQAGTGIELPDAGAQRAWLHDLNLDPAWRVAAGLGALVVQQLQEQLMSSAWDQAGELERANAMLRQAQLARTTAAAVRDKHLDGLPADATLRLTEPLHGRVRLAANGDPPPAGAHLTLRGSVRGSVFPESATSPPFRRTLRPVGPLGRRLPGLPQQATGALSEDLAIGKVRIPIRPAHGGADFDEVVEQVTPPGSDPPRFQHLRDHLPQGVGWQKIADPDDGFYEGEDPYASDSGPEAALARTTTAQPLAAGDGGNGSWNIGESGRSADRLLGINNRFKQATEFLLQHLPATVAAPPPAGSALELGPVAGGLVSPGGALEPDDTVAAEVVTLVPPAPAEVDPLLPRAAAPRFPHAMSATLTSVDGEMLLPGIERIQADSLGVLVGNPRFIEAYMVGINHELSREFLWRGLPTDLAATFANRFWDIRGRAGQSPTDDAQIPPIVDWEGELGSNASGVGGEGMLVVIVRGRLLYRYPHTAFYMARAVPKVDAEGNQVPAPGPEECYPAFRGTIDPDVTYLGFDVPIEEARGDDGGFGWFFVIQEQPTAPRFGLDEPGNGDNEPPASWSGLDWADVFPTGTDLSAVRYATAAGQLAGPPAVILPVLDGRAQPTATWGVDAAQMAAITYQRPMRVAIHASTALPTEGT